MLIMLMLINASFYQLLVIPDGDPPPGEDRVNMKSLYNIFRHTNSHWLVSLRFYKYFSDILSIN